MRIRDSLLRRLRRQTHEQYRVIKAVDVFGRSLTPKSPYELIVLDNALTTTKFLIARSADPANTLLSEMGWSPLDAAALFVLQFCRRELESGQHHAYRGALLEKGEIYHRTFDACIKRLLISGRYDEARADDERETLAEAIQRAG